MDLGNNDLIQSNVFRSGSNILIERPSNPSEGDGFPRGVLNPLTKRYVKTTLNIDSRYRDNYYGTTSSNFHVSLPTKIKKVVEMQLSEIEMPCSFYSISANHGNNFFWIDPSSSSEPKCIVVPDGNYIGEDLANFVNEEFTRQGIDDVKMLYDLNANGSGSGRMIISRDTSGSSVNTNPITLNFSAPIDKTNSLTTFNQVDNGTPLQLKLGWLIGYRFPQYVNNTVYVSEGQYDTQNPRYIYLVVDDYNHNSHNSLVAAFNSSLLSKHILARISLKQGNNNLSSNDYGLAATPPTRSYFGPVDIQKLKIQLLDDYGRIVDMNNMDISIAINLDCLVDN